jgi:hypothetical protein
MKMFTMHDYDRDGIPELHSACCPIGQSFPFLKNAEGNPVLKPFVLGAEGGGHGASRLET